MASPTLTGRRQRRWPRYLRDGLILLGAYEVFRYARALIHGSARQATIHARQIIAAERAIGIFHERAVQRPFDGQEVFFRVWDTWYGTAHFAAPIVGLALLYALRPERYRRWRNILAWTMGLALIGFAFYPLLPPRLLPAHYGFVDTGAEYGGIGPIGKDTGAGAVNAWAAMPSLHLAWSTWAACALWPLVARRWRALLLLIPLSMLFAVTVTANHYFLDVAGGWAALLLGVALENLREAVWTRRAARQGR